MTLGECRKERYFLEEILRQKDFIVSIYHCHWWLEHSLKRSNMINLICHIQISCLSPLSHISLRFLAQNNSTGQVAVLQATLPVIEDAEAKFSHSHSNGVSKGSTSLESNSSSHCHILSSLFKLKILHAYLAPGKSLLKPEQEGLSLLLDCSVY